MPSVKLIVITGNIGSGKTTTLRQIETWVDQRGFKDRVTILFEDVDEWVFYLEKFYDTYRDESASRRNEFGFLLQMEILAHYHAVTKRLQRLHDQCQKTGIDHYVFVERSPFDAKEVFVDTNKSLYTEHQYKLLAGFVAEYTALWMWNNATYIQIDTPHDLCFRRVQKRGRDGENKVTREYLAQLEEAYRNLAFRINMRTLSVSDTDTPKRVAESIWRLASLQKLE